MMLEKITDKNISDAYDLRIEKNNDGFLVRTEPVIRGIVKDAEAEEKKAVMASKFHNTVAAMIIKLSASLCKKYGTKKVVLSGGVFQNKYLLSRSEEGLREAGLEVYSGVSIPVNDSGIPLGQLAIASKRSICV